MVIKTSILLLALTLTGCDKPFHNPLEPSPPAPTSADISGVTVKRIYEELPTATEAYTMQERCGKSAAQTFKEDWGSGNTKDVLTDYEAHYSAKQNRCFMLVTSTSITKERVIHSLSLSDVLGHKELADYTVTDESDSSPSTKKHRTLACEINKESDKCSQDAVDSFAKSYMNE